MPENNQITTSKEPVKNQSSNNQQPARRRFWLFKKQKKQYEFSPKDTKESVQVRQLKKQIKILEDLLDTKDGLIENLQKDLKEYYQKKDENKIWAIVENFLVPKHQYPLQNGLITESGRQTPPVSDEQIKQELSQFKPSQIQNALMLGDDVLMSIAKTKIPGLDDRTAIRALEIAKGMI